ncbi:LexA family transcriptional regulator [Sphingomonas sp. ABOLF]|uniref:LexA family transcriptional regulator n=1 Tax=Sphingomonas sp. ABOLF TaxID=1985879 RepID=UPI000F7E7F2D|nr:LexA family transcriptional regulator [Sphingomonas sp. ABOLF]RSV11643.1 LexA family transcriptional regulator [Sphingomonas sp. ABOLF]
MISLQHHYGAKDERLSTPLWRMGARHQFGARSAMPSANNIERLRQRRGWKRPELARRMDTTPQQVERLEKGQRRLTQDWINRAAIAFGVPATTIIGDLDDDTAAAAGGSNSVVPYADQPPARSVGAGETTHIIKLDLSLPMGPGASVDDYVEEEPLEFDLAYLRSFTRTPPHRLRLAMGAGDSMFPTLVANDLIWIDTTQNELVHSDRIYAASINGGAAIKRLRPIDGGARVLVISDNKTIEPYEVDALDVRIWGRVIRFTRDL